MFYDIIEKLIANNRSQRKLIPQGFVIHSTATPGATAQNEYNYFNSAYRGASAHYFIDWNQILRVIPENEVAWHAGGKANNLYLSVEMCEPPGEDQQKFGEIWKRTVWLVADTCLRYGWSTSNIFSHRDISETLGGTDHTDPIAFLSSYGRSWKDMLAAIDEEIEQGVKALKEGSLSMDTLILVGRGPDERAAGYLADYLKAPVMHLDVVMPAYLDAAQTIYVVGGVYKPLERAVLLSGADRFATCQRVLDFIRGQA